jgi:hypothetical protein
MRAVIGLLGSRSLHLNRPLWIVCGAWKDSKRLVSPGKTTDKLATV